MKITPEDAKKIAKLARLRLSDSEAVKAGEELSAILGYVEKLNQLDVSKVEPLTSVVPAKTPFREDAVTSDFPKAEVTANAPEAEQGMFRVPPVIE